MAFVTGPRQVGKTTACRRLSSAYLNWDNSDHRRVILAGPGAVAAHVGLDRLTKKTPTIVFDELHKFRNWKSFLKGFFDTYGKQSRIFVTGSSRMDVYRRGGDSLMGRYFLYRINPFSVAEIAAQSPPTARIIRPQKRINENEFKALWEHGGYPEPFLKRNKTFSRRWQSLRRHQLLREDIRDLTGIQELSQIEILAENLAALSGTQIVYKHLARNAGVSIDTARRWVQTLTGLHFGFLIRPWFKNIGRSLRKEPKWYLRDWSTIADPGQRAETFTACHLLKAVEGWSDAGLGEFQLRYLRDKEKREVDFAVIRDGKPWMLIEVKKSETTLSPNLAHFQTQCGALHAFQLVMDIPYVDADCFLRRKPTVVPARTLLSQLL